MVDEILMVDQKEENTAEEDEIAEEEKSRRVYDAEKREHLPSYASLDETQLLSGSQVGSRACEDDCNIGFTASSTCTEVIRFKLI